MLELNRQALGALGASSRLAVVEGAAHLFEEPGTLAEAASWPATGSPATCWAWTARRGAGHG